MADDDKPWDESCQNGIPPRIWWTDAASARPSPCLCSASPPAPKPNRGSCHRCRRHFWDEGVPDRLRDGVYRALGEALGITLTTVAQFCADGFYLVPAVRCPSVWGGRDHLPRAAAVRNCSRHLHTSVLAIRPKRVLMLGRVPLRAMSLAFDLDLPSSVRACLGRQWTLALPHGDMTVAATYFPGNNRHRGFDAIVETLRNLMR